MAHVLLHQAKVRQPGIQDDGLGQGIQPHIPGLGGFRVAVKEFSRKYQHNTEYGFWIWQLKHKSCNSSPASGFERIFCFDYRTLGRMEDGIPSLSLVTKGLYTS